MSDDPVLAAMTRLRAIGIEWVRRYHRLDLSGDLSNPAEPVLFVANHGFGGILDVNVLAVLAALYELGVDRPVTFLTHQIAWTLGVGRLLEPLGARPASKEAALEALAAGHHVVVFPGGDLDAFKSRADRDRIVFGGRTGFACLAQEAGVPIRPVVSGGAGHTLLVLSEGSRLAKAMRLDKVLRLKALPASVSIPWGLNVGLVGLLPYLPLPARISTRVLAPIDPWSQESPAHLAARVTDAMQTNLTALTTSTDKDMK